jgi:hypothetical protein
MDKMAFQSGYMEKTSGIPMQTIMRLLPSYAKHASEAMYHGSNTRLGTVEPSTLHGDPNVQEPVVFGTPRRSMALAYLGRTWGNRDIGQGGLGMRDMYLAEMRPNAFRDTYEGQEGYLHTLPAEPFTESRPGQAAWERMSLKPVDPVKVQKVKNIIAALRKEKVRLIEYDPKSPEFKATIRHSARRLKKMSPESARQYREWWAETATPEAILEFARNGIELTKEANDCTPGVQTRALSLSTPLIARD